VGLFPWSMASALVGRHALACLRADTATTAGVRLLVAWIAAWVIPFSLAGTKLPGYVWPAYPALAALIGLFVADWIRTPRRTTDAWMRVAWSFLIASGVGLGIGLPLVIHRIAPGGEWLGLVGLVPLAGGLFAWASQSLSSRRAAAAAWAATACASVAIMVTLGPASVGRSGGARHLLTRLPGDRIPHPIACYRAPASTSFYAALAATSGKVAALEEPAEVAAFIAAHPGAPVVADARWEDLVAAELPADYGVMRAVTVLPEGRRLLLFGQATTPALPRLADAAGRTAAPLRH
jgi:4-amino-4-deoxy-L-arabinose transferase-like glycosyltransferase